MNNLISHLENKYRANGPPCHQRVLRTVEGFKGELLQKPGARPEFRLWASKEREQEGPSVSVYFRPLIDQVYLPKFCTKVSKHHRSTFLRNISALGRVRTCILDLEDVYRAVKTVRTSDEYSDSYYAFERNVRRVFGPLVTSKYDRVSEVETLKILVGGFNKEFSPSDLMEVQSDDSYGTTSAGSDDIKIWIRYLKTFFRTWFIRKTERNTEALDAGWLALVESSKSPE